ncbi:MAG: hypothetical protein KAS38_08920 [Anaerolineales bacterium]|nr:hypothetical protein [Anaerolineales bacterium]
MVTRKFGKRHFEQTLEMGLGLGERDLARRTGRQLKKLEGCLFRVTTDMFGYVTLWTAEEAK